MIESMMLGFTAGVLSLLSPCAFPLLPAYVSYLFSLKRRELTRDFSLFTLTLLASLALMGGAVSFVGVTLAKYFPLFQLLASFLIVAMGFLMLLGANLPISAKVPSLTVGRSGLLGAAYGAIMSSCSIPMFASILLYASLTNPLEGVLTLVSIGAGMLMTLAITTLLSLRAKKAILGKLSRSTTVLHRAGGLMFLAVGVYLVIVYSFALAE
jgi:cytochrome c-type biogenesis protein